MPTSTYDLLDSTTLGTSAASVTFSGISGDYRDLVLVTKTLGSTGKTRLRFRLNSDTGSNYSQVVMQGDGSGTASTSFTLTYFTTNYTEADTVNPIMAITQFMDYSATDKHTSVLCRSNQPIENISEGTDFGVEAYAGRWANTSAVTSIEVTGSGFGANSTFYLYGVSA